MANIKFSAFTQKVAQADVDFLVGYTGADNVRITPAALGDGIYLPLGGGTMTGNINFNDNVYARFGNGVDLEIGHDASNSYISHNGVGNLIIQNTEDDKDIIFKSDDGAGGVETYFYLDGSQQRTNFENSIRLHDNVVAQFGNAGDFEISHTATDSVIRNYTGDLYITNEADDKDIVFSSDNGSGGTASYMSLDGSATRINFFKNTRYSDDVKALFGGGGDLEIWHDSSNSKILNNTGDLKIGVANTLAIQNNAYDENIASFIKNGAVNLYYDSAKKLETTTTGIQVTDEVSIGTSIIHTGDTDTKISFGTDEIVLTTAGADAVTVDSTGNTTFAGDITFGDSHFIGDDGNNNLLLQSSAGEAVLINGNTNVKLQDGGNTKLETSSTGVTVTGDVTLSAAGSTGEIIKTTDNTEPYFALQRNGGSNGVGVLRLMDGGDLKFDTGATGAGQTTRLTIDGTNGNATFEGDIEVENSTDGLILESPDGTRYRVTVANGGTLSVAAV